MFFFLGRSSFFFLSRSCFLLSRFFYGCAATAGCEQHGEDQHGPPEKSDVGVPPLDSWKADLAIWTGVIFLLIYAGYLAYLVRFRTALFPAS